ncbi:hypothetical protein AB0N05_05915 [Nocardia sp. NPDC051030]|uniref:hypothetical protein n=1 Tax=Nocardia sp. NPDC051030 TaxID=3155162 RepID=UPI00343FF606
MSSSDNEDWYDEKAQHDPAWSAWCLQRCITERIEALFTDTLPALPHELLHRVGAMPSGDRFADAMLDWFDVLIPEWFATRAAVENPANFTAVDRVVSYLGEALVRRVGGIWVNIPGIGSPVYDAFGPAVTFDFSDDPSYPLWDLRNAGEDGLFLTSTIGGLIADRDHRHSTSPVFADKHP